MSAAEAEQLQAAIDAGEARDIVLEIDCPPPVLAIIAKNSPMATKSSCPAHSCRDATSGHGSTRESSNCSPLIPTPGGE